MEFTKRPSYIYFCNLSCIELTCTSVLQLALLSFQTSTVDLCVIYLHTEVFRMSFYMSLSECQFCYLSLKKGKMQ